MKFIFLALFLAISGCAGKLRPDASPLSAVQGEYPTAEFRACGSLWHGLGICAVEKGAALSDIGFEVQGYYKGTVKVDSGDCAVNFSETYVDSEPVGNIVNGRATKSCILTMTVSPEYPEQQNTDVVVSGFRGHLIIKVVDNKEDVFIATVRQPETFNSAISIDVSESDEVEVYLSGCGKTYTKIQKPDESGVIHINSDLLLSGKPRLCVLDGFVRSKVFKDLIVTIPVAIHYDVFNILPLPKTNFSKGKLSVEADDAVGILSVGSEYKLTNAATFKVKNGDIVRALTTKGRSVIGVFNKDTESVLWIQR